MNLYEPGDSPTAPPAYQSPAPTSAPRPYTTPTPSPWLYGKLKEQAERAYNEAKIRIGGKRQQMLSRYGYHAQFDDKGNLVAGSMGIDAENPYGQVQQMMRNQADQSDQSEWQQRSRGFAGLGGVAGKALDKVRFQQGAESNELQLGLTEGITGSADELRQAGVDYEGALSQAEIEATQQAIAEQQFNPANAGDGAETEPEAQASAKSVVQGPNGAQVLWGGNYVTKNQLVNILKKKGVNPTSWAKKHPAAAKALGMK